MLIRFINHAGVLLSGSKVKLLMDPWTEGSAFNNGWNLLSRTAKINYDEITHVWISHEHPDHFSISDVKKIIKTNPNVIFLFQSTKDKRVVNFIKKIGGKVIEKLDNEVHFFNQKDFIRIIRCGTIDSIAITQLDGKTIVNMNDCIVGDEIYKLNNAIKDLKIHCLLTQFGYASFISNRDKPNIRKEAVEKKMLQIKEQISFFKPEFVIPFASFIFFSHVENFYMNDEQSDIEKVSEVIKSQKSKPIILYPNDIFKFENIDNTKAIAMYKNDISNIKPLHNSQNVDFNDLQTSARAYCDRTMKFHGKLYTKAYIIVLSTIFRIIGKNPFNKVNFFISDISEFATFHITQGLYLTTESIRADVTISSESLKYVFDYDWGMGTVLVNARLQVKNETSKLLFKRVFYLGSLKNRGMSISKNPFLIFSREKKILKLEPINLFLEKKEF